MKNLLYIFLLLPVLALGQMTSQNYVKTIVYKDSADVTKTNINVTYFDGLGRPIQQIANKQSGEGKDIITHIEYDGFGRQPKDYLPFAATTDNMDYVASAQTSTVAFYNTSAFENTTNPYSEKFMEASPLNRVLKQSAPGTPWLGNAANDTDHTVKFAYLLNTSNDAVKNLSASASWNTTNLVYDISFTSNSTYTAGKLYKTITQNENKTSAIYTGGIISYKLNTTEEYKNQKGQVLLKRTFNQLDDHGTSNYIPLDTYYVYDQFGNLTYVLPPLANGSISQLNELCYQYKYDSRNRMVEKKLPGKAWEFIVYDKLDRIVASGPALSPWGGTSTGWMITKYDALGRVAYTGWYAASNFGSAMRKTAQTTNTYSIVTKTITPTTIDNIPVFYTNSYPTDMKVLTINYYDNYTYANSPGAPTTTTPAIEGQKLLINHKGLSTGNWVRVLDIAAGTTGELTYSYYDRKGRVIRTRTNNYLGGYTQTDSKLDFDGTPQYIKSFHKRQGTDPISSEIITLEQFTYTPQDRLLSQTHTINSLTPQLMNYNTYNEIGQMTSKKVGNTSTTPLQIVDYSYNIRGWLTAINNISDLDATPDIFFGPVTQLPVDMFAFKINYNSTIAENMQGKVVPLYNGNIAETTWRTASDNIQRRYGYTYDNLNRLTDAWYQIPQATVPVRASYDEHLAYDTNGNINSLSRYGELDSATTYTQIDNLAYTYTGNQLTKVTDATNNTAGFKDVEVTGIPDYTYDVYGNMLTDKNKYITGITYNHLNMPVIITVSNGTASGIITYLYNAAGVKLKKTVAPVGPQTVTDYLGGYQYVGGILEFFPTSEGYVKNTVVSGANNYNYAFQYKDHVGNSRITYMTDPADGVLKILEEDHYYPFGLKHNGYSATQQMVRTKFGLISLVPVINPGDATYKYMYQEQERQDELGLNWDSFKYRNYDYAIGRFFNVDPLSEKYVYNSPYAFQENKMGLGRELEGLELLPNPVFNPTVMKVVIGDFFSNLGDKLSNWEGGLGGYNFRSDMKSSEDQSDQELKRKPTNGQSVETVDATGFDIASGLSGERPGLQDIDGFKALKDFQKLANRFKMGQDSQKMMDGVEQMGVSAIMDAEPIVYSLIVVDYEVKINGVTQTWSQTEVTTNTYTTESEAVKDSTTKANQKSKEQGRMINISRNGN